MVAEIITALSGLQTPIQILVIVTLVYLVKGGTFDLPKYLIGKKKKSKTHETCDNYADHMSLLEKERLKGYKIAEIKYKSLLFEQMTKVEILVNKIKLMMTKEFSMLIDSMDISEKRKSDAKVLYEGIVKWALEDAQGYLKGWIKDNHFVEKTDVAFQEYIQKRTVEANEVISDGIDRYYIKSIFHVDRDDLKRANDVNLLPRITPMVSIMFIEVRSIAEEKIELIKQIEEE